MAKAPAKRAVKARKTTSVKKPSPRNGKAPVAPIKRSVEDFTNEMKTKKLIDLLTNIDEAKLDDEDREYVVISLQVEASYAAHNQVESVLISQKEYAILHACQKQQKVEV